MQRSIEEVNSNVLGNWQMSWRRRGRSKGRIRGVGGEGGRGIRGGE